MAINKAMRAALKALSYPDPDIKKSYKLVRKIETLSAKNAKKHADCDIKTLYVERGGYNIPVRVFSDSSVKPRGVILFFHGGGWVIGDIDTYTNVCVGIHNELSRTVVSVDYRRAPEYKFPNATEDCYAVAKALFDGELLPGISPDDITLMGDSAGGNLAAVVSLMAHDRGEFSPKRQILLYPSTGNDHSPQSAFDSIRDNGTDYLLTSKRIVGYMELYISGKEDLDNPYLAPLLANDLRNQPKTLIITAQYCPLRDEGEEYGKRLTDAGNNVQIYRMPDAIHGYFSLPVSFNIVRKTYTVIKRFLGDDRIEEKQQTSWIKLDNAAKIFPPTTTKRDAKVFRFYCELEERIDSRALQAALDFTVVRFPFYRSILKKGIFWYYFESSQITPLVREEYKEPCAPIYDPNRKDLLFEVTYYRNRINFEVYHALSDGEGASEFIKTLIASYLQKAHPAQFGDIPVTDNDASVGEKSDDSFYKYYIERKIPRRMKFKRAYHVTGERLETHPLGVIEGEMSTADLLAKAHEYNSTLTAFLIAVFIRSLADGIPLRDRSKMIVINVPVDLRRFYKSKSARNFFGIVDVEYDLSRLPETLGETITQVGENLREQLDEPKINERMSGLSKFENLMFTRIIPVVVKDPGMKFASYIVERGVTAAFSNLGRITMPDEFAPFIKKFGVMCSTSRIQACMCSYKDRFVINFSSPFTSSDTQCRFFRTLSQMGIETKITSNLGSDNNVIL